MTILTQPLHKALSQLEKGIARASAIPGDELLRDGVIQRFEYTIDLSWKLLHQGKRRLSAGRHSCG